MCDAPSSSKRKRSLYGRRLNQKTACEPGSDTATLVELHHHDFEVLGDTSIKECLAYEQGWNAKHLQHLKSLIEGG